MILTTEIVAYNIESFSQEEASVVMASGILLIWYFSLDTFITEYFSYLKTYVCNYNVRETTDFGEMKCN
jgi:hypothetical protein